MKRAALVLSLALCGCGGDDSSGQNGPLGQMGDDGTGMTPMGGGDRPPPEGPMAAGTVPHFIDADTGEDLGAVLDLRGQVVLSVKLKVALSLGASTRLHYFVDGCRGTPKASLSPPVSEVLRQPTYALGPKGTYWKFAGKVTLETSAYWWQDDHGVPVCRGVSSGGSPYDEYTDTGIPGKLYGPASLKVELR